MSDLDRFRVRPGSRVKLSEIDPSAKDAHQSREEAAKEIEQYRKKLWDLQEMLYVESKRSLLVCLQAMDTGGKDGIINHVLGAMNPQGCRVAHFRSPRRRKRRTTSCGGRTGSHRRAARSSSSTDPTTKTCSS